VPRRERRLEERQRRDAAVDGSVHHRAQTVRGQQVDLQARAFPVIVPRCVGRGEINRAQSDE
jgi:hypothetical protein